MVRVFSFLLLCFALLQRFNLCLMHHFGNRRTAYPSPRTTCSLLSTITMKFTPAVPQASSEGAHCFWTGFTLHSHMGKEPDLSQSPLHWVSLIHVYCRIRKRCLILMTVLPPLFNYLVIPRVSFQCFSLVHDSLPFPPSNHFFPLRLRAFHLKPQSGLLIKSMAFIYDNPIQAKTVHSHREQRKY